MANKVYRNGVLVEVQENGKTVWKDEDYIQRPKISGKSKEELVKDLENGDLQAYAEKTFEILTGETVEEFNSSGGE